MVVIVSPVVPIATQNNRERFLSLLQDVADESFHHEPNCLGYCWLLSGIAEQTTIRGLEIYANEEALTVTHRAGRAYQKFRFELTTEQLAPPPTSSDLVFWRAVAYAFPQRRDKKLCVATEGRCRIITTEYKVDDPKKMESLVVLLKARLEDRSHLDLLLYIVATTKNLERALVVEGYVSEKECSLSQDSQATTPRLSKTNGLLQELKVETWKSSGVGFFR